MLAGEQFPDKKDRNKKEKQLHDRRGRDVKKNIYFSSGYCCERSERRGGSINCYHASINVYKKEAIYVSFIMASRDAEDDETEEKMW